MTTTNRRDLAAAHADEDQLAVIRRKVRELRDEQARKTDIEETLSACSKRILAITEKELPDVMDEAGVETLALEAEGNAPAFQVKVDDRYHANIPADHTAEAFELLREIDAADLIKRQFIISFGLGESEAADRFQRSLEKASIAYEVKQGVPWNTLTAWFREEYKVRPLSVRAMEVLGASVGRVAKVVKRKEKR